MTINANEYREAGADERFVNQYFQAPWAMEERCFEGLYRLADGEDPAAHVPGAFRIRIGDSDHSAKADSIDGVSVIHVRGTLTKYGSSFGDGTSGVTLRKAIRSAARDTSTEAIVLAVDSPGGSVLGIQDVVDEVSAASDQKPVVAYIEDMGASAAYWIASAADSIVANKTAQVGSVGVFMALYDMSTMAAAEGVKVLVFKSGKYKAIGVRGTEITPEQQAKLQQDVDEWAKVFIGQVASARSLTEDQRATVSTADVFMGQRAIDAGLIDSIGTLESAIAMAKQSAQTRSTAGRPQAGVGKSTPRGATHMEDLNGITADAIRAGRPDLVEALTKAEVAKAVTKATETERERSLAILDDGAKQKADAKTVREFIADGKTVPEAQVRFRDDRLKSVESAAPAAPGASESGDDGDSVVPVAAGIEAGEEALRKQYDKSPALQGEFTSVESYIAYKRAEQSGRVKGVK